MYDCPHCGKTAMSWLTKSFLGPGRSVKCRECGKRVSVSWWSMIVIVPLIIGLVVGGSIAIVVWIAGMVIAVAVQLFFVPLVAR